MYTTDLTLADGTVIHQFSWTTGNGANFHCVEDPSYRINRWSVGTYALFSDGRFVGEYHTLGDAIAAANRGELPT